MSIDYVTQALSGTTDWQYLKISLACNVVKAQLDPYEPGYLFSINVQKGAQRPDRYPMNTN